MREFCSYIIYIFFANLFAQTATLPDTIAFLGENISIPIYVEDIDNELEGLEFVIDYNDTVITAISASISNTDLENFDYLITSNFDVSGRVSIIVYAGAQLVIPNDSELVYINFSVIGDALETSSITFESFEVNNIDRLFFGLITLHNLGCMDITACNYNESATYDDGNCEVLDCAGECGGDANYDECGVCEGSGIPDGECDCNGNVLDECDICDGNSWDYCDDDDNGIFNKDQYGYGAYSLTLSDVPNDQGGYLYLSFNKSIYDTDTLSSSNILFDIYDENFDQDSWFANYGSEGYMIERFDNGIWTVVQSLFAYGSDIYQVEVRTLSDFTSTSTVLYEYRVIAAMNEGNFESLNTVTGYSVDNIAPIAPTSFSGSYNSDLGRAVLSWDASEANDISHYNIYKNTILYASVNDIVFSEDITEDAEYSVSAVDIHENESNLTETISMIVLDISDDLKPSEFELLPAYPNPFNPNTIISYSLSEFGLVNLNIYSISGKLVEKLVNESQGIGIYSINWAPQNLSSGVYIIRLQLGEKITEEKVIFIK